MFYGLVELSWFDITTVGLTVVTIVLVQILNTISCTLGDKTTVTIASESIESNIKVPPTSDDNDVTKSLKINELKSLITNDTTKTTSPPIINDLNTNGKLQKQQSEQSENVSISSTHPPTPPLLSSLPSPPISSSTASNSLNLRNSKNYLLNGVIIPTPPPTPPPPPPPPPPLSIHFIAGVPDNLSDEYHEDEDTLSLENLFPCDQTEIYASKKINYIIDELIQTEGNYVNNLKKGLRNYGDLQNYEQLPETLKGEDKQQQLVGNIAEILQLHEAVVLPLMLRNQRDLKTMFDEMSHCIDKNQFYCYISFTMHKKSSLQLRKDNREFFQSYQNEIKDRLGIDSFLVQPIQRLTRYPLLLQQLITEFYKSGINCKPVLVSLCKLETRMRRLLEVVNQSEEILSIEELAPEIVIENLGPFRRSTEFDAYNHRSRKKFRSKVFLFDQCLLCTEVRKRRLAYKNYYTWETIELKLNNSKSITLLTKAASKTGSHASHSHNSTKEEYEFSSPEAISINLWLRCACRIIEEARNVDSQKGKYVLPMDLVLGVVFAIWFIWQYL